MEEFENKLKQLKELLEKGMSNAGIGGAGSVKAGAVLPSISKLPKPGNNSLAGKVKIPGLAQPSQKNPVKSAQQTQNKDIKDIKMKEANAALSLQKEEVSVAKNGQWSLNKANDQYQTEPNNMVTLENDVEKSGYKGYTPEDNARRKANNIGETTGIHTMNSIKTWGGNGPDAATREAKNLKNKSKKNPVKTYTREEIEQLNAERNKSK